jgi:hypothetical protein
MRNCAQQMLAYEAAMLGASTADTPLVSRVLDSLQRPVVILAGLNGWCMLLARALSLAKEQTPQLRGVQISQDGGLEGFQPRRHEDAMTGVILLSQLLGLLASFIGEGATLRIVASVWPGLTIADTEPSGENENAP